VRVSPVFALDTFEVRAVLSVAKNVVEVRVFRMELADHVVRPLGPFLIEI